MVLRIDGNLIKECFMVTSVWTALHKTAPRHCPLRKPHSLQNEEEGRAAHRPETTQHCLHLRDWGCACEKGLVQKKCEV